MKKKKLLSASSPLAKSATGKENVWKNYDFKNLLELTEEQILSLKKVGPSKHLKYKTAVKRHRGRPKKDPNEKENIVSIRFSKTFLERLKKKAESRGFAQWQTYAKYVLEKDLD